MEEDVQLIREARTWIDECFPKKDGKIPGPYKGYVAAFITNLNQLGIVPTLLNAYDSANPQSSADKPNRHDLVRLLAKWYHKPDAVAFMDAAVMENAISEPDLIRKALALKHALRLFTLDTSSRD